MITVDRAMGEEKGIAQHMAKPVTNVVEETTLKQCAQVDPVRDPSLSQSVT